MNNFFDLFNVREEKAPSILREQPNSAKLPFGEDLDAQMKILQETLALVEPMRKQGKKEASDVSEKDAKIFFQTGIIRNCLALPKLLEELKDQFPEENVHIFTYRLNQDCLESFFSVIRAYGATNTAPSALEMKYRIRKYLAIKDPEMILQGRDTNVQADFQLHTLSSEVI